MTTRTIFEKHKDCLIYLKNTETLQGIPNLPLAKINL
jgi:hypothetical protein